MKNMLITILLACVFCFNGNASGSNDFLPQRHYVRIIANLKQPIKVGEVGLLYDGTLIASTSIHGAVQWSVGYVIDDDRFDDCRNFEADKLLMSLIVDGSLREVEGYECLTLSR